MAGKKELDFSYTTIDKIFRLSRLYPVGIKIPFSTDYLFSQVKGTKVDYTGSSIADRLHEITLPALVIWGRHDGIIPWPSPTIVLMVTEVP